MVIVVMLILFAVMELMCNGSLLDYLRSDETQDLSNIILLDIAVQVRINQLSKAVSF